MNAHYTICDFVGKYYDLLMSKKINNGYPVNEIFTHDRPDQSMVSLSACVALDRSDVLFGLPIHSTNWIMHQFFSKGAPATNAFYQRCMPRLYVYKKPRKEVRLSLCGYINP